MAAKLAPLKQSPPKSRIWHRGSAAPKAELRWAFDIFDFTKLSTNDLPPNPYSEIKKLLQKVINSLSVIDPYVDGSLFKILGTISTSPIAIKLLTYSMPSDFTHEARTFLSQYPNIRLQVKKSKEFHDDSSYWMTLSAGMWVSLLRMPGLEHSCWIRS